MKIEQSFSITADGVTASIGPSGLVYVSVACSALVPSPFISLSSNQTVTLIDMMTKLIAEHNAANKGEQNG